MPTSLSLHSATQPSLAQQKTNENIIHKPHETQTSSSILRTTSTPVETNFICFFLFLVVVYIIQLQLFEIQIFCMIFSNDLQSYNIHKIDSVLDVSIVFSKPFSNMHRKSELACLSIFFSRHQPATLDMLGNKLVTIQRQI